MAGGWVGWFEGQTNVDLRGERQTPIDLYAPRHVTPTTQLTNCLNCNCNRNRNKTATREPRTGTTANCGLRCKLRRPPRRSMPRHPWRTCGQQRMLSTFRTAGSCPGAQKQEPLASRRLQRMRATLRASSRELLVRGHSQLLPLPRLPPPHRPRPPSPPPRRRLRRLPPQPPLAPTTPPPPPPPRRLALARSATEVAEADTPAPDRCRYRQQVGE